MSRMSVVWCIPLLAAVLVFAAPFAGAAEKGDAKAASSQTSEESASASSTTASTGSQSTSTAKTSEKAESTPSATVDIFGHVYNPEDVRQNSPF